MTRSMLAATLAGLAGLAAPVLALADPLAQHDAQPLLAHHVVERRAEPGAEGAERGHGDRDGQLVRGRAGRDSCWLRCCRDRAC